MKHAQQGFTLAELMIVVLVLAILATIAYPSYDTFVRNSRIENARADLLANVQMLERFYAQNHTFPANGNSFALKENQYFDVTYASANPSSGYVLRAIPNTSNTNEDRSLRVDENGVMTICTTTNGEEQCRLK